MLHTTTDQAPLSSSAGLLTTRYTLLLIRRLYLSPPAWYSELLTPCTARSLGYLYITSGDTHYLLPGEISIDYPFECPGGVWGDSFLLQEQSGPWCSGPCPAGKACSGGTHIPVPCRPGRYCLAGSKAGKACPAGRWSNSTGLETSLSCDVCPAGELKTGAS